MVITQNYLQGRDSDIEHFVSIYLSEIGLAKLIIRRQLTCPVGVN